MSCAPDAAVFRSANQSVDRAHDTLITAIQHVRVDDCGFHALVVGEFLDGVDIVPLLEKVSREGVAQCVRSGQLGDVRGTQGTAEGTLAGARVVPCGRVAVVRSEDGIH